MARGTAPGNSRGHVQGPGGQKQRRPPVPPAQLRPGGGEVQARPPQALPLTQGAALPLPFLSLEDQLGKSDDPAGPRTSGILLQPRVVQFLAGCVTPGQCAPAG
jgi:hypothetical protein